MAALCHFGVITVYLFRQKKDNLLLGVGLYKFSVTYPRDLMYVSKLTKCLDCIVQCVAITTPFKVELCMGTCVCVCARAHSVAQSCLTLSDPMDCSLPGSSVHGILQARILEWVTISSSRESSWVRDQICISCISCFGRWILYYHATWETPNLSYLKWNKFSSSVAIDTFQVLDSHTWLPYRTAQIQNISVVLLFFRRHLLLKYHLKGGKLYCKMFCSCIS